MLICIVGTVVGDAVGAGVGFGKALVGTAVGADVGAGVGELVTRMLGIKGAGGAGQLGGGGFTVLNSSVASGTTTMEGFPQVKVFWQSKSGESKGGFDPRLKAITGVTMTSMHSRVHIQVISPTRSVPCFIFSTAVSQSESSSDFFQATK